MCHRDLAVTNLAIAQLAEHLTVEHDYYQMVPGSIPGGRTSQKTDKNMISDPDHEDIFLFWG